LQEIFVSLSPDEPLAFSPEALQTLSEDLPTLTVESVPCEQFIKDGQGEEKVFQAAIKVAKSEPTRARKRAIATNTRHVVQERYDQGKRRINDLRREQAKTHEADLINVERVRPQDRAFKQDEQSLWTLKGVYGVLVAAEALQASSLIYNSPLPFGDTYLTSLATGTAAITAPILSLKAYANELSPEARKKHRESLTRWAVRVGASVIFMLAWQLGDQAVSDDGGSLFTDEGDSGSSSGTFLILGLMASTALAASSVYLGIQDLQDKFVTETRDSTEAYASYEQEIERCESIALQDSGLNDQVNQLISDLNDEAEFFAQACVKRFTAIVAKRRARLAQADSE
ncbi:hypothetical protein, partial [Rhodopirellula bahusiensis]